MNEAIDFISQLGFPIFVAVYLLIFVKKAIDKFNDAIKELKNNQVLMIKLIEKLK